MPHLNFKAETLKGFRIPEDNKTNNPEPGLHVKYVDHGDLMWDSPLYAVNIIG